MQVKIYGTRGSTPVSGPNTVRYGGNTTCLRIKSDCLPEGNALVVDMGSGYVPLSLDLLKEKILKVNVLMTHYHHDHTQGVLLAPHTFVPAACTTLYGPKEHGDGPQEVMERIMVAPLFPVDFPKVRARFQFHNLEHIGTQVVLIHPQGGVKIMLVDRFDRMIKEKKQVAFDGRGRFSIQECLIIKMYKTAHPEYTVSYRFEEMPTGRVFVFLTDHEAMSALPGALRTHIQGAHLLIQDGQYSTVRYKTQTAGFGHGTPEYCVETAHACGVPVLGLTHHDPLATDTEVEERLAEAKARALELNASALEIFACRDYQEVEV